MSFSSLVEAFEALNRRKRDDADGLDAGQLESWRRMRSEIETALFQRVVNPDDDRREYLRVPVSCIVRFWTSSDYQDRYIPEIGEGGLFVATHDPLPVGSVLHMNIILANRLFSFAVKGEVVWTRDHGYHELQGMGIKFIDLSHEQKFVIYNLANDSVREQLLERRRVARLAVRLPIRVVQDRDDYPLRAEDVSSDGLFIGTEYLFMEGERLEVTLELPDDAGPLRAFAEVVRAAEESSAGLPSGVGVRFLDVAESDENRIRDFILERLQGKTPSPGANGDQRHGERIKRRIPIRYVLFGREGVTFCRDISVKGAFIQTHEPPARGVSIQLTLASPNSDQTVSLNGKVIRSVQPRAGETHQVPGAAVVFEDVDAVHEQCLREILRGFVLHEADGVAEAARHDWS